MITLATLSEATQQQIFDQVSNHLLTQNCKSSNGVACLYRGPNNTKCAAGCLIADNEYHVGLENKNWERLLEINLISNFHFELIADLQRIHDIRKIEFWREDLIRLAEKYQLTFNVPMV